GYIGSRATGDGAGDYLVAGPGWQGSPPAGVRQVFHSSTQFTTVIYRTQLFNPQDMQNVERVQAGYKVQPLSAYLHRSPPPPAPPVNFPKIDRQLAKENFFDYLEFVLQFAPPGPEEKDIRTKLARIGIGAGKKFNISELSPEHKIEVDLGVKDGEDKVAEQVAALGRKINGWNIGSAFGDRDFYHGNWLMRAAAAKAGIYGNDAVEAVYPATKTLADGSELDGSKHKYALTFAKDQYPPVNAFWSLTLYDGKTQLLIENPIDRYLVNSPMLPNMKQDADGSLTIYIQKDSPGQDRESNWLPAPSGPMYLVMRLYWPKSEPPSILPAGDGSWQPPAIRLAD
ncbi:MAG TPA: DUF1214 domain-containing protein, partial [Anaerolineales bacterium]|nr:DUF1214 domain-containing protein [Anaerolineales bacterium]